MTKPKCQPVIRQLLEEQADLIELLSTETVDNSMDTRLGKKCRPRRAAKSHEKSTLNKVPFQLYNSLQPDQSLILARAIPARSGDQGGE